MSPFFSYNVIDLCLLLVIIPLQQYYDFIFSLKDGSTYYQVEWASSWENKDDIVGCEKFIQDFHIRQEKEIFGGSVANNKLVLFFISIVFCSSFILILAKKNDIRNGNFNDRRYNNRNV